MTQLTALGVSHLTDDCELNAVRDLNQLRTLKLDHGRLTDKGLRVLKNLTALRSLSLQYCNSITNKGLKAGMLPLSRHSLAQVDVKGCRLINSANNMKVACCLLLNLAQAPAPMAPHAWPQW
ncbi:g7320 [Coccomyxa viridis]|uniref:G7320 protein n=1 Tax=Coccomyxa viridis TaxID=1274662 RepID=A0ABP1G2D4_9CHLO